MYLVWFVAVKLLKIVPNDLQSLLFCIFTQKCLRFSAIFVAVRNQRSSRTENASGGHPTDSRDPVSVVNEYGQKYRLKVNR